MHGVGVRVKDGSVVVAGTVGLAASAPEDMCLFAVRVVDDLGRLVIDGAEVRHGGHTCSKLEGSRDNENFNINTY